MCLCHRAPHAQHSRPMPPESAEDVVRGVAEQFKSTCSTRTHARQQPTYVSAHTPCVFPSKGQFTSHIFPSSKSCFSSTTLPSPSGHLCIAHTCTKSCSCASSTDLHLHRPRYLVRSHLTWTNRVFRPNLPPTFSSQLILGASI